MRGSTGGVPPHPHPYPTPLWKSKSIFSRSSVPSMPAQHSLQMDEAMGKNPGMKAQMAQMSEMMKNPMVQQQMQQYASFMQNQGSSTQCTSFYRPRRGDQ